MAVVDQFEGQREEAFQPRGPELGQFERQALGLLVLGKVIGGNAVDGAVSQPRDDRLAVGFAAQRRRKLGEGAVLAHGQLVQSEIGRGGVAGNGETLCLCPAYALDAACRRYVGGVVAPARHAHQRQVAFEHDCLGLVRDAGQTEAGRELARLHDPARGERRFLGVLHDQRVERLSIFKGP